VYNPRLKYWKWVVESIQINSAEASHQISFKFQESAVKGSIMIRVKDIMTTELITVSPETEILQAAKVLLGNHINGVPVVDEAGKLVGILCQSDLIAQQKRLPIPSVFTFLDGLFTTSSAKQLEKQVQKIAAITVAQAMTPDPVFIEPKTSIEVAAGLMVDKGFHTLPVLASGDLVGIVGKEDILTTLLARDNSL
jgi:CBS domain-containing protein